MSEAYLAAPRAKATPPDMLHVVLALYDPHGTYACHAGVLMTSLFARTERRVRVTVLHDSTLTDDNRLRLRRTGDRHGQSVGFVDASTVAACSGIDLDRTGRSYSRGSLWRLFIPELLDIPRAIYLDCDIAVNMDIGELWDIPLEGVSLAAVRDSESSPEKRGKIHNKIRSRIMRYDAKNYFNSGVLLMNLDRIRTKYNLAAEGKHFFERYRHCADFPDQDFLNTLFRNDVLLIDERFNRTGDTRRIENTVLHLTGKYKPWTLHRSTSRDYFYWRTFAESEWRDRLADAMMTVYRDNPVAHFHSSDCVRRVLERWKRDLFVKNIFARALRDLRICATELRYRISGEIRRK